MCPFCCALEFAMIEAEIQYQIIRTYVCGIISQNGLKMFTQKRNQLFHVYIVMEMIFDTINIINELKRLQKDTSKDKILSYTEGYDKFSAMTVVKYAEVQTIRKKKQHTCRVDVIVTAIYRSIKDK